MQNRRIHLKGAVYGYTELNVEVRPQELFYTLGCFLNGGDLFGLYKHNHSLSDEKDTLVEENGKYFLKVYDSYEAEYNYKELTKENYEALKHLECIFQYYNDNIEKVKR